MKTKEIIVTLALLMAAHAQAQQVAGQNTKPPTRQFTTEQKIELAGAINLLFEDDVLDVTPDRCLTVKPLDGRFTSNKKVEIENAMKLLVDEHVLDVNPNECMHFDGDIITQLRQMGLLVYGDSKVLTVCIDPMRTK